MSAPRPRKQLRTSRACDFCHKRSIRCKASAIPDTCENCIDFGLSCTYNRPVRRGRGRQNHSDKPAAANNEANNVAADDELAMPLVTQSHPQQEINDVSSVPIETVPLEPSWKAFASVSHYSISSLINMYFQIVYPIFPFFDQQILLDRVNRQVYLNDRDFFAALMAVCAIVAGRIEDGSVPDNTRGWGRQSEIKPSVFFMAAEECLPCDIIKVNSLDALRAYPLMALAAIQGRKIEAMHKYIGQYFTIMSIKRWHDESNWPTEWTSVERDEMRRVYWSTYTLDVYSSVVWNGCVHFQEAHSQVQYPSQAPSPEHHLLDPMSPSWMVGWNFTTDLYRTLEHAISRLRTQRSRFNILESSMPSSPTFSFDVSSRISVMFTELPDTFKTIKEMSGVPAQDIYGFQAANIQATSALLRMVSFSVEAGNDIDKKCAVASELLDVFHQIPKVYLTAIGVPLIYHLSGIGHILGSVFNTSLTESSYAKVRELLVSMAALLDSLESVLHKSAGAGKSLLEQVGRIDQFMAAQRQIIVEGSQNWDNGLEEVSPQYQLPDDILLDWTWPLDFTTMDPFLYH